MLGYCDGSCGATQDGDQGDCASGDRGSFGAVPSMRALQLPAADNKPDPRWSNATAECLRLCRGCARCSFVSISVAWRDCSWYHACGGCLAVPPQAPPGFRSLPVGPHARRSESSPSDRSCWPSSFGGAAAGAVVGAAGAAVGACGAYTPGRFTSRPLASLRALLGPPLPSLRELLREAWEGRASGSQRPTLGHADGLARHPAHGITVLELGCGEARALLELAAAHPQLHAHCLNSAAWHRANWANSAQQVRRHTSATTVSPACNRRVPV